MTANPLSSVPDLSKHRFNHVLLDGKLSDFTLIYKRDGEEDREVKVHKIFLYASSEYFQKMFDGPWKEKTSANIALTDSIDFTVFQVFLTYLYTGSFEGDTLSRFGFDLYTLADYYAVPELTKSVVTTMKQSMTIDN
eukprot:gene1801-1967_t